jgi:hypothetical protein
MNEADVDEVHPSLSYDGDPLVCAREWPRPRIVPMDMWRQSGVLLITSRDHVLSVSDAEAR